MATRARICDESQLQYCNVELGTPQPLMRHATGAVSIFRRAVTFV